MAKKGRQQPRKQPPPPARKFPVLPIIGGAVGVALVVAIAISLAGSEEALGVAVETGSPTISGALPVLENPAADVAVGMPIPSVSGTNFDGEIITIGPDQGPGGVVFLAHWCSHCRNEVPAVQAWLDGGAVPAAPIYSVSTSATDTRDNYPPWSWLEREGWTSPVLVDDDNGSVMSSFGGRGFPYWVFFDGEGNVVARVEGEVGIDNVAQLLELAANA